MLNINKDHLSEIISESIDYVLIDNQFQDKVLFEDKHPYYVYKDRKLGNLADLWNAILKKQQMLCDEVFSELDEMTREKANLMGQENLLIPRVMFSAGNTKVPQNILMINITSALLCPSYYLGICTIREGACYAQRDENQYNNTRYRNAKTDLMNTELLRKYQKGNKKPMRDYFSLVEMYIQIGNAAATNIYRKSINSLKNKGIEITPEIESMVLEKSNKYKISGIRLNESGDFPCQLSVNLWSKFAKKVGNKYGIKVHAYTARNLDFSKTPDNFSVLPSHGGINIGNEPKRMFCAVTDEKYDSLIGGNQVGPGYQPILGTHNGKKFYKCPCGEGQPHCDDCRVCFSKNKTGVPYTIFVRYHGLTAANGLKHLFKKDEVENTINLAIKNGWTTPQEIDSYNSERNVERLNKVSNNIAKLRKRK